ncbi:hypothetical protein T02_10422 [Trichinella nativa]|uniref:Uncharacterized protein n=1 Tax=Trichinella nativa TaxID=6335 RepID=A0A0V1LIL9_9BILA|nr:hypothetical protein T02_10422 [Trichinella nativa]
MPLVAALYQSRRQNVVSMQDRWSSVLKRGSEDSWGSASVFTGSTMYFHKCKLSEDKSGHFAHYQRYPHGLKNLAVFATDTSKQFCPLLGLVTNLPYSVMPSSDQPPAVSKSNLAIAPAGDEMHVQSQNILDSFATMKAPMSSSLDRYERISGRWIFSSFFQRVHCSFTLRGKGSSHDAPACQRIWRSIFTRTVDGAKHSPGSKMQKAVFNGFRFECTISALCTISGGEKVSFSTPLTLPVDNERVQQVIPGTDGSFSSRTDFSTSGSLLIHLCRWKSPLANNPCNLLSNSLEKHFAQLLYIHAFRNRELAGCRRLRGRGGGFFVVDSFVSLALGFLKIAFFSIYMPGVHLQAGFRVIPLIDRGHHF